MREFVLLAAVGLAAAKTTGWPEDQKKNRAWDNQVWRDDWQMSCAAAGGSVYTMPDLPRDADNNKDTAKARCGHNCKKPTGNCQANCGDMWCTGFSFDDWNGEKNHCGGTHCPSQPAPVPAPCDCQGPHTCSAWGDPHMEDFDGWKWDFGGDEEYEMFGLEDGLKVTSENWHCNGGGATCMKRVNLWSPQWEGEMGEVSDEGGSIELDKEGRLYVGCKEVNPRKLGVTAGSPYTVPGTKGQLQIKELSRPEGEWVESEFVLEYNDDKKNKVTVNLEAPIGKWTTSAWITFEGCKCDATGLCNGPLEIWDCLGGSGGFRGLDVPKGCGALPPSGDPKRKSGLCKKYGDQNPVDPPDSFPPRDCRSEDVLKAFNHCCSTYNEGECGNGKAKPVEHADKELPRTTFYEQCRVEHCQLSKTEKYCLSYVDEAAKKDKKSDCKPPEKPNPTMPPEEYENTPSPPGKKTCEGDWSPCDELCTRKWAKFDGKWDAGCEEPSMSEAPGCKQGDGKCPKPPTGNCHDDRRGADEEGVDCGKWCAKECIACHPKRGKMSTVDGVDCEGDDYCAEIVFAPPTPPDGVGCQAPCEERTGGLQFCEQGEAYLQPPETVCGMDGEPRLSETVKVYARGAGEDEEGGVGKLNSDVFKLNTKWDPRVQGQPTICYTPKTPGPTAPVEECEEGECEVTWRRNPDSVRPTTEPEGFTPDVNVVKKKDSSCNEEIETCDVVVTVKDKDHEPEKPSTCVDEVCGLVDLVEKGKDCDSSNGDDFIARGIPARNVDGRSELRQADVPAAEMTRAFDEEDKVCYRPRTGAAPKKVNTCVDGDEDCGDLEEFSDGKGDGSDSGVNGLALGLSLGAIGIGAAAVAAGFVLKGKGKGPSRSSEPLEPEEPEVEEPKADYEAPQAEDAEFDNSNF